MNTSFHYDKTFACIGNKTKVQRLLQGKVLYSKDNNGYPIICSTINNECIEHVNKQEQINNLKTAVPSNYTFIPRR